MEDQAGCARYVLTALGRVAEYELANGCHTLHSDYHFDHSRSLTP